MLPVDTLLTDLRQVAEQRAVPILRIECEHILVDLVRKQQPLRLLEIGTAIGYSTLLLATAMPEDATLVSLEIDVERVAMAKMHIAAAGYHDRVTILAGDALSLIDQLSGGFDFVFLDGPKGQYLAQLRRLMDKLAPAAVIVADNVLFRGMVTATERSPRRYRSLVNRLREYLVFVSQDKRFVTTVLADGDGVAVSYYQNTEE